MFQIIWQDPRASQTPSFYWPRLLTQPTAGRVLFAHAHNVAQSVGKLVVYGRTHTAATLTFQCCHAGL